MRSVILFILHLFFVVSAARAEIAGALSLEWITCASEVVAVGKIVSVENNKGTGDVIYADCVLKVTRQIKGPPRKEIRFCYRYLSRSEPWAPPKGEVLVCLTRHKTPFDPHRLQDYTDPYYESRLHDMLVPTNKRFPLSIIDLDSPEKALFDTSLARLDTAKEILECASSAAKTHSKKRLEDRTFQITPLRVNVPSGSEAFKILFSGSGCFVQVPKFMRKEEVESGK